MIIDWNANGAFIIVDKGLFLDRQDVCARNCETVHSVREIGVQVYVKLEPTLLERFPILRIFQSENGGGRGLPEGQLRGDVGHCDDSIEASV